MVSDAGIAFFGGGIEYYISGRYAVFARLTRVAGNLFHHAVERVLKGYLTKSLTLEEMRTRKLGHNLAALWQRFKELEADQSLDRFDSLINELDSFEELRYPDKGLKEGMCIIMAPAGRNAPPEVGSSSKPVPFYQLVVAEIDELIALIFERASVNPRFFLTLPNQGTWEYLSRENANPWASGPPS
jgi:hypothetical protein